MGRRGEKEGLEEKGKEREREEETGKEGTRMREKRRRWRSKYTRVLGSHPGPYGALSLGASRYLRGSEHRDHLGEGT